jgi:N-hydroxyarylamine O-acetyltransferase
VLEKLGLSAPPSLDFVGLHEIYAAWCRRVPFDNIRKLIWLREEIPGPLPGDDPAEFFDAWLTHGTGGTCWAGNGALQALLEAVGFDATRGLGTMLAAPDVPPNHGTVRVTLEGEDHLVDASILFDEPLRVEVGATIDHPAWGVRIDEVEGKLHVIWRPFFLDSLDCRIEKLDSSVEEFQNWHEFTRGWGPFNFSLSARLIEGDKMIGAAFGPVAVIDEHGKVALIEMERDERVRFLVERLGISEEMATRLPPDAEMPPPPR